MAATALVCRGFEAPPLTLRHSSTNGRPRVPALLNQRASARSGAPRPTASARSGADASRSGDDLRLFAVRFRPEAREDGPDLAMGVGLVVAEHS